MKPTYEENPAPKQAHRLTLRIADAPGPLKVTVSAVQFDVVNKECLPPPKDNPGGRTSPVPTNDIPFELTHVSDDVYSGVFYSDGMIDADYYGRGVCRWRPIQAQVQLQATGGDGETKFIASLSHEEFGAGPKTLYYAKQQYPRASAAGFPAFGVTDPEQYKAEIRDALFRITLAAEGVTP